MLGKAAFDIFILCLRSVQGTAALVVNLLTVICVVKYESLRNPAGLLVTSLAVSDILHGAAMYTLPLRTLDQTMCKWSLTAEWFTLVVQVPTFALLAMQRRNFLLAELGRSSQWGVKKVALLVTGVWASLATLTITYALSTTNIPEESVCNLITIFPRSIRYVNLVIFASATITVIAFYGSVAQIMRQSSQQAASNTSAQQRQEREANMRTTKMMALVVGVFFGLYIPLVISIINMTESPPMWQYVLHHLSVSITDINFFINPIIYAWRSKQFRKAFQKLFSGCRCCRTDSDISAVSFNTASQQVNIQGPILGTTASNNRPFPSSQVPRIIVTNVPPKSLQVKIETPLSFDSSAIEMMALNVMPQDAGPNI